MIRNGFVKGYANTFNLILRFIDWTLVLVSGIVSYYFSAAYDYYLALGQPAISADYFQVTLLAMLLTALIFPLFAIYRVWRGTSVFTEIKYVTMSWCMVALLLAVLAFITKTGADYSRSWMGIWFALGWILLVGFRIVLRIALRWLRASGFNQRHIVIVGTGEQAIIIADRLMKTAWFGLEIAAFFKSNQNHLPVHLSDKKLITDISSLQEFVDSGGIDQVWIALPHSEEETIREVIKSLEASATEVRYVPDIFEYQLMHHSLAEIGGVPVVNISYTAIDGANRILKTMEDYLLTSMLLILTSPVMLLIAIGVRLSSKGPIFYRQKRVGWNGKEFTMFKFRTMPLNIEQITGPIWASQGESRATPVGSFLRKTSLDELPQLFNVLRGEMSLIGPRPERPVFVEQYKKEVPHYMKKHLVKAGLTGWAQVHGWRGNTCLHTRIEHDLYYIENWSLWLDIKIIILTIFKGFMHKNAY